MEKWSIHLSAMTLSQSKKEKKKSGNDFIGQKLGIIPLLQKYSFE